MLRSESLKDKAAVALIDNSCNNGKLFRNKWKFVPDLNRNYLMIQNVCFNFANFIIESVYQLFTDIFIYGGITNPRIIVGV